MRKPCIAFVTGGYSGEAAISYESAKTIEANLDREKFDVYKIDIRTDGWFHTWDDGSQVAVNKADFSLNTGSKLVTFDAVFIGIHGTPGEDGKLQGYFDLLHIPYTSCNAATSAITFNKSYTVAVAAAGGISVARSLHFFKSDAIDPAAITSRLQLPVFVKPNNGGSSIGMSKVQEATDLQTALDKAFREDDQVLVEEFISGREFTIGVCRINGRIETLPITEVISQNDFFDYEAKYQGKSREVTPAEVEESIADAVRAAATRIYHLFNCSGIVRIDFIYNQEKGQPFMLEINTVPGQSAASIVPQQVQARGWTLKAFYTGLIESILPFQK